MRTGVMTKTMAPLTKAMDPANLHTKDMARAGRGHADEYDRRLASGDVAAIADAARVAGIVAKARPPRYLPCSTQDYAVTEPADLTALDADELGDWLRTLRRARKDARADLTSSRARASQAEANYQAITDALAVFAMEGNRANITKVFSDLTDHARRNVERVEAAEGGICAMMKRAEAEAKRREPKSVSAMSRELDELRSQIDELRGTK